MPLRRAPVQLIPRGVDTSTGSRHVQPGQMVVAENVRFAKKGEARKRLGWGATLSAGFSADGSAFAAYPARDLGIDGGGLAVRTSYPTLPGYVHLDSVYQRTPMGNYWRERAPTTDAYCEVAPTAAGARTEGSYTFAEAGELPNGYRFTADVRAGTVQFEDGTVAGGAINQCSIVPVSATSAMIFLLNPGAVNSSITYFRRDYSANGTYVNQTFGYIGVGTMIGTGTGTPLWDAVYLPTANEVAVAFRTGTNSYSITSVTPNYVAGTKSAAIAATACDKVIAFLEQDETSGYLCLGTASSTAGVCVQEHLVSTYARNGTITMDASQLDCRQITGWRRLASSTHTTVAIYEYVSGGYRSVGTARSYVTGTNVGTTGAFARNCGLFSRCFKRVQGALESWHYATVMDGAIQNTVHLRGHSSAFNNDTAPVGIVAVMMSDASGGVYTTASRLPRVSTLVAGTKFSFGTLVRSTFSIGGSAFSTTAIPARAVVDFDPTYFSGPAELGGTHWPGGLVTSAVGETNYVYYPEIVSATGSVGGSLAVSTVYNYTAVYHKIAENGDVVRSPEAYSVQVTTGGAQNAASLVIKSPPGMVRSLDQSNGPTVDVYRTPQGGDGTAFYKCGSGLPVGSFGYAATFTFLDTMSDATLLTQEKLYTTGDVLENVAPPSSRILKAWKNRLVACQRTGAWISREYWPGFGVGFNDIIAIGFDDPGGDITAAEVMDDRVYFHRAGGIWALTGDGPDDRGEGGYDRPVQVTTVSGAIRPKLVAVTPLGQVYVNNEGVQLLDRGHNVQFIGAPVLDLFTPSTATKVLYVPEAEEFRVFTSSGSDFVYDMATQAWTVDTHPGTPFVDAVVWSGAVVGLTAAGGVYQESASSYQDQATTNYAMKLKTGKISVAGISGASAVYEVTATGECMAACTLRFTVTTYGAGTSRSEVFNRALTAGRMTARAQLRHIQCSEFEVTVEEIASSGQAVRIEALTAWVGTLPGPDPVRAANRMTPT